VNRTAKKRTGSRSQRRFSFKDTRTRIAIAVSVIAGLAAFLANIQDIRHFFTDMFDPAGVRLVSASFTDTDSLDIQLRNTGKDVSVVKRIDVIIRKKWVLAPDDVNKSVLIPSGIYNLQIDTFVKPGDIITRSVSQQLEPGKADRFFVAVGTPEKDIEEGYVYLTDVVVVCDEDEKTLTKPNVFFYIEDKGAVFYKPDGNTPTLNSVTARSIDSVQGLKSGRLNQLLRLLKDNS
jgi:hypothetical protein